MKSNIQWRQVTNQTECTSFVGNSVCTVIKRPSQPNPANRVETHCITTKSDCKCK